MVDQDNLQVEWWDIDRPIDYARNAKKITDADVQKMAALVKEYGWKQVILVDPEGVIIAGHLRRRGGKAAGKKRCPVVVAHDLTKAQIKAFRLADNRISTQVKNDFELLALELHDLKEMDFDLSLTAFEKFELDPLLAAEWRPDDVGDLDDDADRGKPKKDPKLTIEFTPAQYEIVGQAIFRARDEIGNKATNGQCVELLAQRYLDEDSDLKAA